MVQEADVCSVRKKLGLSQEKLAEKLGVTRNTISRWESGKVSPTADNLIALNRLLAQMEDLAAPKAEPAPPPVVPAPPPVVPAPPPVAPAPPPVAPAPPPVAPAPPSVAPAPVRGKRWPFVLACVGFICALLIGIAALIGTYSVKRQLEPDYVIPIEEIGSEEVEEPRIIESGTLQPLQP